MVKPILWIDVCFPGVSVSSVLNIYNPNLTNRSSIAVGSLDVNRMKVRFELSLHLPSK